MASFFEVNDGVAFPSTCQELYESSSIAAVGKCSIDGTARDDEGLMFDLHLVADDGFQQFERIFRFHLTRKSCIVHSIKSVR